MKKLSLFLVIAVLVSSAIFAQGNRERQADEISQAQPQSQERGRQRADNVQERNTWQRQERDVQTIEGTLKLEGRFVAVESGENVYLVPMLNRYIGFINGLTEGTRVTVVGTTFRNNVLHPRTVTIGGRSYEFDRQDQRPAFGNNIDRHRNDRPARRYEQSNYRGRRNSSYYRGCCR